MTTFDLHERHGRLEVVADAVVETMVETSGQTPLSLASLKTPETTDLLSEYLASTPRTTMAPAVVAELRELTARIESVPDVVATIMDWVRDRVAYVKGATQVSSTAQEAWDQRQGVPARISRTS